MLLLCVLGIFCLPLRNSSIIFHPAVLQKTDLYRLSQWALTVTSLLWPLESK